MGTGPNRCGKGIIARVIEAMLGISNLTAPTLTQMGGKFGLESFIGKSACVINIGIVSARAHTKIVEEPILSILRERNQIISRKHRTSLSCRLSARFVIFSDLDPSFVDSSQALASRMVFQRKTPGSFRERQDFWTKTEELYAAFKVFSLSRGSNKDVDLVHFARDLLSSVTTLRNKKVRRKLGDTRVNGYQGVRLLSHEEICQELRQDFDSDSST